MPTTDDRQELNTRTMSDQEIDAILKSEVERLTTENERWYENYAKGFRQRIAVLMERTS